MATVKTAKKKAAPKTQTFIVYDVYGGEIGDYPGSTAEDALRACIKEGDLDPTNDDEYTVAPKSAFVKLRYGVPAEQGTLTRV